MINLTYSDGGKNYFKGVFLRFKQIPKAVGQEIVNQTVRRIAVEKESPEGKPWQPLSNSYLNWKKTVSSGGILELYGHLRDSITYKEKILGVDVGTNLEYAGKHQFGDGVPERKFLGISSQNERDIQRIIENLFK